MRKLAFGLVPAFMAAITVSTIAQQQPPPPKPPQPQPHPQQQQPMPVAPPIQQVVIPCPQFQAMGPNRPMRDGEVLTFVANVGGGDPNAQPIFNWSVSAGVIVDGQGTRSIKVDSTGTGENREIIADLLVAGYGYECPNKATAKAMVAAPAKKVDEFGELPEKDETGKLDSIVSYLSQAPDRIFLIGYAGRNNVRGYAGDVLRRMKAYITKNGLSSDRIAAVDGGFREKPAYEIWVVPIGAEAPKSTPTIDRKDIVYPKPPPKTPVKKP